MCAPKAPKVEKTPVRAQSVLPNGGDVTAAEQSRRRRPALSSALVAAAATLGAPVTTAPLGMTANG